MIGARCAGSATAIALARAGRRVVALDRVAFPSDTLSTHLLFAGGVAELDEIGALGRVEAIGAPRLPEASMADAEVTVRARYTPVGGIDYGMCVRRPGLDAALVATARDAGAEVRERSRVVGLLTDAGRVTGVEYEAAGGERKALRAPLVVGADGRGSTVARLTGGLTPYRSNANGRACFFAYFEDARPEWREVAAQWRVDRELGTAFPCDDGLVMVLLMPPRARFRSWRDDMEGEFARTVALMPGLQERLEGSPRATKIRSAIDTTSYFRRASGPGWALPGDSGHFKDPVTAQGIRDAVRYGRLLGEAAAPALDSPRLLDRALRRWERRRERECLECYAWTNRLGRADPMSPIEEELYRDGAEDPELARRMLDVFSRTRRPGEAFALRRGVALTGRALRRPGADRLRVVRAAVDELGATAGGAPARALARIRPLPDPRG